MSTAANSAAAALVARSGTTPISFNGDDRLFTINMFLALTFTVFAVVVAGRFLRALIEDRKRDTRAAPILVFRLMWLFAGIALMLRVGIEAAELMTWNPRDPVLAARMIMAKRWILPASTCFTGAWMVLGALTWSAQERQMRKYPVEVEIFARLPMLKKPLATIAITGVAAIAIVWLRG